MCENLGHWFKSRLYNFLAVGFGKVTYPACLPAFVKLCARYV